MTSVKYYSGTTALRSVFGLDNKRFAAIGGERTKHNRFDGFARLAGYADGNGALALLPVTRKIFYKSNPSLHKCDSRCTTAKGHNCECSCGGEFHGSQA